MTHHILAFRSATSASSPWASPSRRSAELGVSRKQLSDIFNGHAGISPEMAIRLDKAFGGGALTWLRLQAEHDLA